MYPMDGTIETLKASNDRLRAVNAKLLEALERIYDESRDPNIERIARAVIEEAKS